MREASSVSQNPLLVIIRISKQLGNQSRYFAISALDPGQGPEARKLDPCDLG